VRRVKMIGGLLVLSLLALVIVGFITYMLSDESWKATIISLLITSFILVSFIVWYLNGTESGQRAVKDLKSDVGGGIERVLYVYDYHGNLIKTYEGRFDIQENDYGSKVKFELNGKRIILYNSTIIVEEQ
jgi:hypothetical protein